MNAATKKPPLGYSLGDDYEKAEKGGPKAVFVEIHALTPEQEQVKHRIEEAREALKLAESIQAELKAALEQCKHPVFNDRDGWLYYCRDCFICGAHIDDI